MYSDECLLHCPSYDDATVSSVHCKLLIKLSQRPASAQVWLEDHSSNGTYVNAQRVGKGRSMPLSNLDQIGFLWPCSESSIEERPPFSFVWLSASETTQTIQESTNSSGSTFAWDGDDKLAIINAQRTAAALVERKAGQQGEGAQTRALPQQGAAVAATKGGGEGSTLVAVVPSNNAGAVVPSNKHAEERSLVEWEVKKAVRDAEERSKVVWEVKIAEEVKRALDIAETEAEVWEHFSARLSASPPPPPTGAPHLSMALLLPPDLQRFEIGLLIKPPSHLHCPTPISARQQCIRLPSIDMREHVTHRSSALL